MNKTSTLIECAPDKNIIYTMSEIEGNLVAEMFERWRYIYGKYPRIQDMIDYVRDYPEIYGRELFKNIKIEEKKLENKIKGKTANYCFVDDCDLYDRFVENGK